MHSNQVGPAAHSANSQTTSECRSECNIGSADVMAQGRVPSPVATPSPPLLTRCLQFVVDWQLTEPAPLPRRTVR